MSESRITEILEKAKTNNEKGIRTSTYATDYIYQGKGYSITSRFTVLSGTNLIILFDMTNCTREVSLYTPIFDATTGPILIDYYIGADYVIDDATTLSINNRVYYGDPSEIIISYGALSNYTGTTKGTLFSNDIVISGHKAGGGITESFEFVPVPKQKILLELDNTNGTDATMGVRTVWYEV